MSEPLATPKLSRVAAHDPCAAANARFASRLVEALLRGGTREAVISPGSRNTPLALALLAAPGLRAHVVLDERVAGFVALGLAKASGRPVLLSCTSGSAGAHYLPALVEARALHLPLVALTANRPAELWDNGAPQTIEQRGLFGEQVRWTRQLAAPAPEPTPNEAAWLQRLVAQALACAGPVHFDLAFREPLWAPGCEPEVAAPPPPAPRLRPRYELDAAPALLARERGLIVVGPEAAAPADEDDFAREALALSRALGWPLVADPLARVRWSGEAIGAADTLLRDPELVAALRPEAVLRFGRIPTSKPVQRLLTDAPTLLVDRHGDWHDPSLGAEGLLVGESSAIAAALRALAPTRERAERAAAPWARRWRDADRSALAALRDACRADEAWAGAALAAVVDALPAGGALHVASSMPIRDLDAFGGAEARALRVSGNRGANGIDGTLATACGVALARAQPVTVLCGDLAFLHDASGLLAARGLGVALTIVVLDNGGGGIFHYLPIEEHPAFERLFLTPQSAELEPLAAAAGAAYRRLEDAEELRAALSAPGLGVRVLHLPLAREHDLARHAAAYAAAAEAGRAALRSEPAEVR
ncbi:MAG TPA: 2-succinyl-5-enolpyruvyl-6-hydroxy-3-cyclohexene-1-carboxylic-acid synthase, partial [Planctomycetes bacterium]|nr:2-succinyl-5-enolpyruvyl-6-hydroxy-3-cyclohexene-1-carboxylic-acid synthase [Planctomycetota bacterium]